jgi:predicted MFS family arabinose efflux permease
MFPQLAMNTFTVSFSSSAYSGGLQGIARDLQVSDNLAILGISLYVLGFALGYVLGIASLQLRYSRKINIVAVLCFSHPLER